MGSNRVGVSSWQGATASHPPPSCRSSVTTVHSDWWSSTKIAVGRSLATVTDTASVTPACICPRRSATAPGVGITLVVAAVVATLVALAVGPPDWPAPTAGRERPHPPRSSRSSAAKAADVQRRAVLCMIAPPRIRTSHYQDVASSSPVPHFPAPLRQDEAKAANSGGASGPSSSANTGPTPTRRPLSFVGQSPYSAPAQAD